MTDTLISIGARLRELAAERPDLPGVTGKDRTVTGTEVDGGLSSSHPVGGRRA